MSKELTIVREYHLNAEKLEKLFDQTVAKESGLLKGLVEFSNKVFFLLSVVLEKPNVTKNEEVRDVLHLLLSRAMKSHRAISLLVRGGQDQDAIALLRNVIETAITARYIVSGDTEQRAQRFRDYQEIERYKNMAKNRRVDPNWLPPGGKAMADKLVQYQKDFKKNYCVDKIRNWHGLLAIEDLAREAGMEGDYLAYSNYCVMTHPSFLSAKDYAYDPIKNGNASWAPTYRMARFAVCLGVGYLQQVVQAYIDCLGIKDDHMNNVMAEVQSNLLSFDERSISTNEKLTVQIKDGLWGTLPAWLQEDLKPTGSPETEKRS